MATASRVPPPARRTAAANSSIAKGATARSAVSPKVNANLNGPNRRTPSRGSPIPHPASPELDGRENLVASLKREIEEKEELLVRIQQKEQTITGLSSENQTLTTTLNAAEARLSDVYADQARLEEEMSARLDLVDRLRAQIQELEREKRESTRRYNEQTAAFDAERQSFYDNEQHLKSRIQSLTQSRDLAPTRSPIDEAENESLLEPDETDTESVVGKEVERQPRQIDEENEPAEMTALRLELSTLSTSYSSLQTTVQLLSSQLLDLKRVNHQLQEDNESYNILLREKTLSGQFDILRTVGSGVDREDQYEDESGDGVSVRSVGKTSLDPVEEIPEDLALDLSDEDGESQTADHQSPVGDRSRRSVRTRRTATGTPTRSRSPPLRGESLADLPITGPGLDLAAELGRAENLAILEGRSDPADARDRSVLNKKKSTLLTKETTENQTADQVPANGEIDALRSEVKSLKDANKALSLYASKIIDRIIAQEGFEHVLAADYDKPIGTPKAGSKEGREKKSKNTDSGRTKIRGDSENREQAQPPLTTAEYAATREKRRSLSFDWKSFSVFGAGEKKPDSSGRLPPVVGARKLETHEDEEDRKERERMNATLKLMGIEKPESQAVPIVKDVTDSPSPGEVSTPSTAKASSTSTSRFSFFRSKTAPETPTSPPLDNPPNLTEEALERSEAANSIAALDARELVIRAEIAKGASGGFTELPQRRGGSKRSRKSLGSGSCSTVWSAGMSVHNDGSGGEE